MHVLGGLFFCLIAALSQGLLSAESRYIVVSIGSGGKIDSNPVVCGDDVSCGIKKISSCNPTNPVVIQRKRKTDNVVLDCKNAPTTPIAMDDLFP